MPGTPILKRPLEIEGDDSGNSRFDSNMKRACFSSELETSSLPQISQVLDAHKSDRGISLGKCSGAEDICFGMLKHVRIRINHRLDFKSLDLQDLIRVGSQDLASLELIIENDRCDIAANGHPFATLNTKTHLALHSASSAAMLRYTGLVPYLELCQKLTSAGKRTGSNVSAQDYAISILIYGHRSVGKSLAKTLSRYHLFLQHPMVMPVDVVYENPQYLSMVGSSFANGAVLPPISAESLKDDADRSDERLDEYDSVDLATTLDNLPKHHCLPQADIDPRIRTTLLSHQKEAVDFLLSRESIGDSKGESLWKTEGFISEEPKYKHIITGSKSSKPDDILGGILADGMGLGKTLSMIAAITTSLVRAEKFASEKGLEMESTTMSPIPVKSTLVILPSMLLLEWLDEIEKHLNPGTLSWYKYHGPDRKLPSNSPLPYDVVFSTYGTVSADFARGGGVLRCFHWYRVVLDEAHVIRNWSTKQFKAVASLSASIRWCITGTPIQNSLEDLASLVKFLRVPQFSDLTIFRRHIEQRRNIANGVSKPDYRNLRLLLGSLCLRRSTSSVLKSLGVTFVERRPSFSKAERTAYDDLGALCSQYIKAAVSGKSARGNRLILTAMLRLRMFCNTGLCGPTKNTADDPEDQLGTDEEMSLLQQSGEAVCVDCGTSLSNTTRGTFAHRQLNCEECVQRALSAKDHASFSGDSLVAAGVTPEDDIMEDVRFELTDGLQNVGKATYRSSYPSKILSLLDSIKEHYKREKGIVFSFWRGSLDLVGKLLREEGIVFDRVDGNVPHPQRRRVLAAFHDDPAIRVLLMTIGTGAVGINNLSVASYVHILEPQWNPSVEDQAIGRVVRLGQEKRVTVIRYIMEQTIEECIESRQILKLQVASKGGLRTSDLELSESERRVQHLQKLGKIIASTVLTRPAM